MDTTTNNVSQSTIAFLRIRYSSDYTEDLTFISKSAFLRTLADALDTYGINGVTAATVLDENNLNLRYRVHEMLVGAFGYYAIPERYWRLSLKDHALMGKLECLMTFEKTEHLENSITQFIPDCERDAVIVEPLASRLSDNALLELVDALYEAMPASYRKAV